MAKIEEEIEGIRLFVESKKRLVVLFWIVYKESSLEDWGDGFVFLGRLLLVVCMGVCFLGVFCSICVVSVRC